MVNSKCGPGRNCGNDPNGPIHAIHTYHAAHGHRQMYRIRLKHLKLVKLLRNRDHRICLCTQCRNPMDVKTLLRLLKAAIH